MTTIAFKDGVLAADSQLSDGDDWIGNIQKLHVLPDGTRFACAGSAYQMADFVSWVRSGMKGELNLYDFEGIIVSPDDKVTFVNGQGQQLRYTAPFYAFGSGSAYALGAMAAGASAADAVAVAAIYDANTDEPIQVCEPATTTKEPALLQ